MLWTLVTSARIATVGKVGAHDEDVIVEVVLVTALVVVLVVMAREFRGSKRRKK